jgi:hypothetical protein
MFTFNEVKELYENKDIEILNNKIDSSILRRSLIKLNNVSDYVSWQRVFQTDIAILNSHNSDLLACILLMIDEKYRNSCSLYERDEIKNNYMKKYNINDYNKIYINLNISILYINITGRIIKIESFQDLNSNKFIIICKDQYNDNSKYTGIGIWKNNTLKWLFDKRTNLKYIKDFKDFLLQWI